MRGGSLSMSVSSLPRHWFATGLLFAVGGTQLAFLKEEQNFDHKCARVTSGNEKNIPVQHNIERGVIWVGYEQNLEAE